MKSNRFFAALLSLAAVSCTITEVDRMAVVAPSSEEVFHAVFGDASSEGTKVYVDEDVKLLWNADDRISIFNKKDANEEYRFIGDTGDNGGDFKRVNSVSEEGVSIDHIYAVYPYNESTSFNTDGGTLSVTFPEVQTYRVGTFGPGANAMVSATDDNLLQFRNLGGYLVFKFYGEGISVSSVILESVNGEILSGDATVSMEVGGEPTVTMSSEGNTSLTLHCETPVTLGATKEEAVTFWMVLPPTDFTEGFTLRVIDSEGRMYIKKTTASVSIVRNRVRRIAAIEVDPTYVYFEDEGFGKYCLWLYDLDGDGEISLEEAADDGMASMIDFTMGGEGCENEIRSLKGIEYFVSLTDLDLDWDDTWPLALTDLDLSQNTKLSWLSISDMPGLTSLDLSHNKELETLMLSGLSLNNLDLSQNTALETVNFNSLGITSLDLSQNTALTSVYVLNIGDDTRIETVYVNAEQDYSGWKFVYLPGGEYTPEFIVKE